MPAETADEPAKESLPPSWRTAESNQSGGALDEEKLDVY